MTNARKTLIASLIALAMAGAACSNNTTSPSTVSGIAVTGAAPAVGTTAQFTATATMSDGTTQDVTSQAAWASSDGAVATVSSTGLVTGVTAGAASVTATYQSVTGADPITIVTP